MCPPFLTIHAPVGFFGCVIGKSLSRLRRPRSPFTRLPSRVLYIRTFGVIGVRIIRARTTDSDSALKRGLNEIMRAKIGAGCSARHPSPVLLL